MPTMFMCLNIWLQIKTYFPFDLSFPLGLPDGLFPAPVILSLADFVPANIGCISENILKYNFSIFQNIYKIIYDDKTINI